MADNDFKLHLRVFAPFKTFGGGFEGDNRGHTTKPCVTARIYAAVSFNPLTGTVVKHDPFSYESTFVPLGLKATAKPLLRTGTVRTGSRSMYLQLDVSGANPLVPKVAPDIDVHLQLNAAMGDTRLNLSSGLTGDAFPNAEVFVEDHADNRRMLQTFSTTGGRQTGPATLLWGNKRRFMNGTCASFSVDPTGRFV